MTMNYYVRCKICGRITRVRYQLGYSKMHPVQYKCLCGITIRGFFLENKGLSFNNGIIENEEQSPSLLVTCSGEFLTVQPCRITEENSIALFMPSPFILSTQTLDYEAYREEFTRIINYRDTLKQIVDAINELYDSNNEPLLKVTLEKYSVSNGKPPILNNKADIFSAISKINQIQFYCNDGKDLVKKVQILLEKVIRENSEEFGKFAEYICSLNCVPSWENRIHKICEQIFVKIDMLMPAISVDFMKDHEEFDYDNWSLSTASFEDVKQLYVDLYELLCGLLILVIGLDNISQRKDFDAINSVGGLNVNNLHDVSKMRNKGNILKILESTAPFESLICSCLDADIRNSIGHFSYESKEIANEWGQKISFEDPFGQQPPIVLSLSRICHDIWQMYKTLGIFNEVIYQIEMYRFKKEGIIPTVKTEDQQIKKKKKIYPNEDCPCGSGKKYKKCCGKNK